MKITKDVISRGARNLLRREIIGFEDFSLWLKRHLPFHASLLLNYVPYSSGRPYGEKDKVKV